MLLHKGCCLLLLQQDLLLQGFIVPHQCHLLLCHLLALQQQLVLGLLLLHQQCFPLSCFPLSPLLL